MAPPNHPVWHMHVCFPLPFCTPYLALCFIPSTIHGFTRSLHPTPKALIFRKTKVMTPNSKLLVDVESAVISSRRIRRDATASICQNRIRLIVQVEVSVSAAPLRAALTSRCDLPMRGVGRNPSSNRCVRCAIVGIRNSVVSAVWWLGSRSLFLRLRTYKAILLLTITFSPSVTPVAHDTESGLLVIWPPHAVPHQAKEAGETTWNIASEDDELVGNAIR